MESADDEFFNRFRYILAYGPSKNIITASIRHSIIIQVFHFRGFNYLYEGRVYV